MVKDATHQYSSSGLDPTHHAQHFAPSFDGEGPGADICDLCNQGRWGDVVDQFDPDVFGPVPSDLRVLNGLTNAHLQLGNVDRATQINDAAAKQSKALGDNKRLAVALCYRARMIFESGEDDGLVYQILHEALSHDPLCVMAMNNGICYASKTRDPDRLNRWVNLFITAYPAWSSTPMLCDLFEDDADLTWARQQDEYKAQIQKHLNEKERSK